eukprot:ctg_2019.g315
MQPATTTGAHRAPTMECTTVVDRPFTLPHPAGHRHAAHRPVRPRTAAGAGHRYTGRAHRGVRSDGRRENHQEIHPLGEYPAAAVCGHRRRGRPPVGAAGALRFAVTDRSARPGRSRFGVADARRAAQRPTRRLAAYRARRPHRATTPTGHSGGERRPEPSHASHRVPAHH